MKKSPIKGALLDRMHRGAVWTCMGLTLYGTYLTGVRVYNYFTITRPMRKQQELEMLREGTANAPALSLDTAKEIKL